MGMHLCFLRLHNFEAVLTSINADESADGNFDLGNSLHTRHTMSTRTPFWDIRADVEAVRHQLLWLSQQHNPHWIAYQIAVRHGSGFDPGAKQKEHSVSMIETLAMECAPLAGMRTTGIQYLSSV